MFYHSFHRKASSEGRHFVINFIDNLGKSYKTVRESFITNKV